MGNVWDATKLMLIIYGLAALVSFMVAWVIKLTFVAIRMHSARNAAPSEAGDRADSAAKKSAGEGGD